LLEHTLRIGDKGIVLELVAQIGKRSPYIARNKSEERYCRGSIALDAQRAIQKYGGDLR
jgi:hypothetical protein